LYRKSTIRIITLSLGELLELQSRHFVKTAVFKRFTRFNPLEVRQGSENSHYRLWLGFIGNDPIDYHRFNYDHRMEAAILDR